MIQKVLIANRGEIAVRIAHTLREMGIARAGVVTEPDRHALHARMMDEVSRVESYMDAEAIVKAAKSCQADAVHPGYGFLSESTILCSACDRSGPIFIGPRTDTIGLMGDKLESKRVMLAAGIPVVPMWEASPPSSEYPVMVKAAGGGGGKGMRLARKPEELGDAMGSASREAESAFGDGRVFIEKYIPAARHIECQIVADDHGNVLHLFERECSIQRRHQKIIEESPAAALSSALRSQMSAAAIEAARAVRYRGAGTVEFLLEPDGRFYFLEMNTRLQVEHPVTEMVTGIDLVREQVRIAAGQPLSFRQADIRQAGHSIECRIYAEVPEAGFRPSTGTIAVYRPPEGPGIRLDSGVEEGSSVTFHYDPLLAKMIVHSADRQGAIARMRCALEEFALLGVETNIEFLGRIISHPAFAAASLDTRFLERYPEVLERDADSIPAGVVLAACLSSSKPALQAAGGADKTFTDVWASGTWRNT